MKRLLPLMLMAILVPQVVLAAWWNPFSWFNNWRFSPPAKEIRTEELENRIKELEEKLENTATSTPLTTATTSQIKSNPVGPSQTPIQSVQAKKAIPPKEENFSATMVIAYNNQAELLSKSSNIVGEMIAYIDSNLSYMTRLRNSTKAYSEGAASAGKDTRLLDAFVGLYDADIKMINSYRNYFVGSKDIIEKDGVAYYRKIASVTLGIYVSRESAISELQKITSDTSWERFRSDINNKFEEYKKYRTQKDNEYEEWDARIAGLVSGYENTRPTYTPPSAPVIQIPTVTNTYCNVYSNTISCDSYSR